MDLNTLRNSFNKVIIPKDNTLCLTESDGEATLNKIEIYDVPPETFAVKIDKFKLDNVFKTAGKWNYNKHGDYLIVTEKKLIFIEMKSAKKVEGSMSEQLRNKFLSDTCIISYFDSIFSNMLSKNSFFKDMETLYIAFYRSPSIQKFPTNMVAQEPEHTSPEKYAKFGVHNEQKINFNRLCTKI